LWYATLVFAAEIFFKAPLEPIDRGNVICENLSWLRSEGIERCLISEDLKLVLQELIQARRSELPKFSHERQIHSWLKWTSQANEEWTHENFRKLEKSSLVWTWRQMTSWNCDGPYDDWHAQFGHKTVANGESYISWQSKHQWKGKANDWWKRLLSFWTKWNKETSTVELGRIEGV
jgi:hypothetical protein